MTSRSSNYGFEVHSSLTSLVQNGKANELQLAHKLYLLKRYDLWRDSVGGMDRWEDYLKQPEIGIPVSKANKLIRIYEYFGQRHPGYEVEGVPVYALDYIAKKNPNPKDIPEMLDAARNLSQVDFKDRFHDMANSQDGEAFRTYSYMIMQKCNETGNLKKVHDISSEEIKSKFNLE
jgi:hypothetical protein